MGAHVPYAAPLIIGAIIVLGMSILAWSRRPHSGLDYVQLNLLAMFVWVSAYSFELAHVSLAPKVTWIKVEYTGLAFFPVFWLLLTLKFTGRGQRLTLAHRLAALALPTISALMVWTNDWHGWFWSDFSLNYELARIPIVIGVNGWYYSWVFAPYLIATALATSALLLLEARKVFKSDRTQGAILLVATFFPWASEILTHTALNPLPGFYWAPLAVVITLAILLWYAQNFGTINILPVAYRTVIHSLSGVIIVLNPALRIVDVNQPAERLFQKNAAMLSGRLAPDFDILKPVLRDYDHEHELTRANFSLRNRYYDLHITPLRGISNRVQGHIIALHDITQLKHAELAEIQQREIAEALRDAAAVVNSSLDQNEILARIHEIVQRVVPHKRSSIALVQNDQARIVQTDSVAPEYEHSKQEGTIFNVNDIWHMREMAQKNEPAFVADVKLDKHWITFEDGEWIRSYIGAPIMVDGKLFGFINLDSDIIGQYSQADADNLQTFSDQVASAIENAQLHQQLTEQANGLRTLHEISLQITEDLDRQATLDAITENTLKLPGIVAAGIYLYQPDDDILELVSVIGDKRKAPPRGARIRPGEGLTGTVWANCEPMTLSSYKVWEGRSAQFNEELIDDGPVGAVPIIWKGEPIGVLPVTGESPEHIEHNLGLLTLLAGQAAVALENARLYEETIQLYKISQDFTRLLEKDALQIIADGARDLLKTQATGIFLHDPVRDLLVFDVNSGGVQDPLPKGYTIKQGEGINGLAWQEQKSQVINDYQNWSAALRANELEEIQAAAAVPITAGKDEQQALLGVMVAASTDRGYEFSPGDVRKLELLADQAAIAISNTRLYQQVAQQKEQLAALSDWTRSVSESLDAETILEQIVELAVGYMDSVAGGLYLHDEKRDELVWKFPYNIENDPRFSNTRLKRNEGLAGRAWAANKPLYRNQYDDWDDRVSNLANVGAENLIVAPITVGGDFQGVLCVLANHARSFTKFDLYLMELLSAQAAVAIQNADMYTEMLSYAQELNQRNTYLDTFSKAVAHDLLGPMSLCASHVKLLQAMPAFADNEEAQSMLTYMADSVVDMESIVDDLLLLAQVQIGEEPSELVEMAPVVQAAADEYAKQIVERGITLEIQSDLPSPLGYAPWLERVFSNLIGNAVKYIGKQNEDPRICIRSSFTDGMLRYEVIDNGLGIAKVDQQHVFEVFTRFNSEHVKGYGIGLAIVYNIVNRFGGELGVESEAGKGSTFWFTLHPYKRPPLISDE